MTKKHTNLFAVVATWIQYLVTSVSMFHTKKNNDKIFYRLAYKF